MRASPAYISFATVSTWQHDTSVLGWFQNYTTARRQTMDPRRILNAMSNAPVAFMLLVMGSDISNAFLGNIWARSTTPVALTSRWFIPIIPQGAGGQRCFHTDCSLHAARERKEAQDPPHLVKIQTPPPLSVPVYSLATVNEDGSTNMNIVTYASPVSIEPDRLWMVSLYKSTLSHQNFFREGWGVLQLLRRRHAPLVSTLGKTSGRDTDKSDKCLRQGFSWEHPAGDVLSAPRSLAVLPDCAGHLTLQLVSHQPAGDHDAALCRILCAVEPELTERESMMATPPEMEILETRHLREAGIIS